VYNLESLHPAVQQHLLLHSLKRIAKSVLISNLLLYSVILTTQKDGAAMGKLVLTATRKQQTLNAQVTFNIKRINLDFAY
jgi:hypothetical protein